MRQIPNCIVSYNKLREKKFDSIEDMTQYSASSVFWVVEPVSVPAAVDSLVSLK